MSPPIAVVLPCYGYQDSLNRVLDELFALRSSGRPMRIYAVDDGSTPALVVDRPGVHLLRHPHNKGYGAAQKTGYALALAHGAERVVMLHGDGQYPTEATVALADALDHSDVALGSRFLEHRGEHIPAWRRWGNRFLTSTANARYGVRLSELHTGARAFRASVLLALPLESFSDDFVFDQQVLAGLLARRARFAERPLQARYDDTVSSIGFRRSIRYGLGCLWTLATTRPTAEILG
jgi:glycosyltransferase involved in cell wall biosynthesis